MLIWTTSQKHGNILTHEIQKGINWLWSTGLEHGQDILNSERKVKLKIHLFDFTIAFILLLIGAPLGYENGVRVTVKLRLKH